MTFADELRKRRACIHAVDWVGSKTREEAWANCPRASWMMWYATRVGNNHKKVVLTACACLHEALPPDDDEYLPSLHTVEVVEDWCRDEKTREEVLDAISYIKARYGCSARAAELLACAAIGHYTPFYKPTATGVITKV